MTKYCPYGHNAIGKSVCVGDGCAMYADGKCTALTCTPSHKAMCPYNNELCAADRCAAYAKGAIENERC